jgi:hypothetical protein
MGRIVSARLLAVAAAAALTDDPNQDASNEQ